MIATPVPSASYVVRAIPLHPRTLSSLSVCTVRAWPRAPVRGDSCSVHRLGVSLQMDSGAAAGVLGSLDDLFEQSRSADGRAALAGAGRPRALALLVPATLDTCLRERSEAAVDKLLSVLRTLRNSCAGVADAKEQLRDARCAEHLAHLLCALAREPALERRSLLLATALQVLGNSSVQDARSQEATWCAALLACAPHCPANLVRLARAACFPAAFAEAAAATGAPPAASGGARTSA
jgi:hypothetical protein